MDNSIFLADSLGIGIVSKFFKSLIKFDDELKLLFEIVSVCSKLFGFNSLVPSVSSPNISLLEKIFLLGKILLLEIILSLCNTLLYNDILLVDILSLEISSFNSLISGDKNFEMQ